MREQRRFHSGDVAEAIEVEVSVQLAIQARQNVLVEGRGDSLRIVVGGQQDLRALGEIGAQQQSVARSQRPADAAQNAVSPRRGSKFPMLDPMYSTSLRPLMRLSAGTPPV